MNGDAHTRASSGAPIQPVVLVGGRSTRFGRDKLLEPVLGKPLVLHAIDGLRAVFGPCVLVVGACDPRVRALADGEIADLHAGAGPIGGVVSALAHTRTAVCVLAGDMPAFSADDVRALLAARARSGALAVWAWNERPHPCAGVYEPEAIEHLRSALAAGRFALRSALPEDRVTRVHLDPSHTLNVNTPDDCAALGHGR